MEIKFYKLLTISVYVDWSLCFFYLLILRMDDMHIGLSENKSVMTLQRISETRHTSISFNFHVITIERNSNSKNVTFQSAFHRSQWGENNKYGSSNVCWHQGQCQIGRELLFFSFWTLVIVLLETNLKRCNVFLILHQYKRSQLFFYVIFSFYDVYQNQNSYFLRFLRYGVSKTVIIKAKTVN